MAWRGLTSVLIHPSAGAPFIVWLRGRREGAAAVAAEDGPAELEVKGFAELEVKGLQSLRSGPAELRSNMVLVMLLLQELMIIIMHIR